MHIHALIAALALVSIAHGQGKKFSFRTLCFSYVDKVSKVYLPDAKSGEMLEVPLYTEVYSLPLEGDSKDSKATFFLTEEASTSEKKTPSLTPVKLPDSSKLLFLFLPNPGKTGQPYRVMAMADDTASFPLGSVKILNLTPAELRFDLGEFSGAKGIRVSPGKTAVTTAAKKVNHLNHYDAKVLYQLKPGEFSPFYNSRWRSIGEKRDLVIVYLDPTSKQPVVAIYEDVPPTTEPPAN